MEAPGNLCGWGLAACCAPHPKIEIALLIDHVYIMLLRRESLSQKLHWPHPTKRLSAAFCPRRKRPRRQVDRCAQYDFRVLSAAAALLYANPGVLREQSRKDFVPPRSAKLPSAVGWQEFGELEGDASSPATPEDARSRLLSRA
jgi:hypothetical protein